MLKRQTADQAENQTRRQVTHGILALADQGFVSLTTFTSMVLVAQLCVRSDVNLYALAWSVFLVFRIAQERMLAAPYVVFAHQQQRDSRSYLGSSLVHQACFAVATSLVLVACGIGFALRGTPAGMPGCLWVFAAAAPWLLLRDHLRAVSCAHFRYDAALCLSAAAFALQVSLIFMAYYTQLVSVLVVFAAMGVASLIPCLAWHYWRPVAYQVRWSQVRDDWLTTWDYSRWLVAARCFPAVASSLMPWIVLWRVNEDASGALASCLTLANLSMMFVTGANNFFQPRAVKALHSGGKGALCRVLGESVVVFVVTLSGMCVFYLLLGGWLLTHVYGPDFGKHGAVVTLLGVNVLVVSLSMVAGNGMAALGKPKGLFWGEVAYAAVTIPLAMLLSFSFGLVGTAAALCCGSLVAATVAGAFFLHLLSHHEDLLPQTNAA